MKLTKGRAPREHGQMIVLFALSLSVMLLMAGLVIDGGYAFAQRRLAQNTSDLAALAGARVLASYVSGDRTNGTDENVVLSIDRAVAANGGSPISYRNPGSPEYVSDTGAVLDYVGTGSIPGNAVGVRLGTSTTWKPFFLGIIGVSSWSAGANATARG
ncbi:MAG TPA: Tad domain-containing protein, partial [Candidatus Limnocylindrales bacterium]